MNTADTTRTTYLSCADTAKMVRGALKAAFPGQKFSVRSNTYAGGASINVSYLQAGPDAPKYDEVNAVADAYSGSTFDGMIDLKSYHSTLVTMPGQELPELVHFGADFVFVNVDQTPEYKAALTAQAKALVKTCKQEGPGAQDWDTDENAYLWVTIDGQHMEGPLYSVVRALANPKTYRRY